MELRLDEVIKMTRLSNDAIYRKGKDGTFPKRFKIDKTHVRWHLHEIQEWIKQNRLFLL